MIYIAVAILFLFSLTAGLYAVLKNKQKGYQKAFPQLSQAFRTQYDLLKKLVDKSAEESKSQASTRRQLIQACSQALISLQELEAAPGDPVAQGQFYRADIMLQGVFERFRDDVTDARAGKTSSSVKKLLDELDKNARSIKEAETAFNNAVDRYNNFRNKKLTGLFANLINFDRASRLEL
jgi:hypothetical protein